ncbi:MAG: hypothetical protein ACOVK6_14140 [Ramlibacter sp.]
MFTQGETASVRSERQSNLFRRCLPVAVPVMALAGGAVSYALASSVNTDNYDQGATYQLDLRNGLIGAAGLVGGALLPLLAACGRSVIRGVCERRVQVAPMSLEASVPSPSQPSASKTRQGVPIPAREEFQTAVTRQDLPSPPRPTSIGDVVTIHGLHD